MILASCPFADGERSFTQNWSISTHIHIGMTCLHIWIFNLLRQISPKRLLELQVALAEEKAKNTSGLRNLLL